MPDPIVSGVRFSAEQSVPRKKTEAFRRVPFYDSMPLHIPSRTGNAGSYLERVTDPESRSGPVRPQVPGEETTALLFPGLASWQPMDLISQPREEEPWRDGAGANPW